MEQNVQDIIDMQTETLELFVKAGRRCAYDLRHAADNIRGDKDNF